MREGERRRRLLWLNAARVVVGTLLLGLAVGFQLIAPGSVPVDPFFFLIGLTYALSAIYAAALPAMLRHSSLVDLEFVFDACLITAFIHFTGGSSSGTLFYPDGTRVTYGAAGGGIRGGSPSRPRRSPIDGCVSSGSVSSATSDSRKSVDMWRAFHVSICEYGAGRSATVSWLM